MATLAAAPAAQETEKKAPLHLTPQAIAKVREIMATQDPLPAGLRIGVVGGGCSGFQYSMAFENQSGMMDKVFGLADVPEWLHCRLRRDPRSRRLQVREPPGEVDLRLRFLVQRLNSAATAASTRTRPLAGTGSCFLAGMRRLAGRLLRGRGRLRGGSGSRCVASGICAARVPGAVSEARSVARAVAEARSVPETRAVAKAGAVARPVANRRVAVHAAGRRTNGAEVAATLHHLLGEGIVIELPLVVMIFLLVDQDGLLGAVG